MSVLTAVAAIGCLTLLLATVLVLANRTLRVVEDPRVDAVEDMLPHTNCGGCGYPGCRPFAEALVQGKAEPGRCTVSNAGELQRLAQYLGVGVGTINRRVARLACAGGSNVARQRAHYVGQASCRAAQQVSGGSKSCSWGCIGLADCERVCDFDAITMDHNGLPQVDAARCTACGDCVDVCPRDLFSLQAEANRLWVACANPEQGDPLREVCEAACTACGRCAQDAETGSVIMLGNLPVVDYNRPQQRNPIERCPTGAIVWIEPEHGIQHGAASPRVHRHSPLHDAAS